MASMKKQAKLHALHRITNRFWSSAETHKFDFTKCWEWNKTTGDNGYGSFRIGKNSHTSSRACWILTRGTIPPDKHVCHTCDNPSCVNPIHLFIGSPSENAMDCVKKGRWRKPFLDINKARFIRAESKRGVSIRDLAKSFCCSSTTIALIKLNRTWKEKVN